MDLNRIICCLILFQVEWMPFGELDFDTTFRLSRYRGTIRWQGKIESYMPDRVARQFGRVQGIPLDPIAPTFAQRPYNLYKKYQLEFADEHDHWADPDTHLWDISQIPRADPGYTVTDDYMAWYMPRSHTCIDPTSIPPAPFPGFHPPGPPAPPAPPVVDRDAASTSRPPDEPSFTQAVYEEAQQRLEAVSSELWDMISTLPRTVQPRMRDFWRRHFGA